MTQYPHNLRSFFENIDLDTLQLYFLDARGNKAQQVKTSRKQVRNKSDQVKTSRKQVRTSQIESETSQNKSKQIGNKSKQAF